MKDIPKKDRASDSLIKLESDLSPEGHPGTKVLGLKRNTRTDSIVFSIEVEFLKFKSETLYRKREEASIEVKVLDPIGLIATLTVKVAP